MFVLLVCPGSVSHYSLLRFLGPCFCVCTWFWLYRNSSDKATTKYIHRSKDPENITANRRNRPRAHQEYKHLAQRNKTDKDRCPQTNAQKKYKNSNIIKTSLGKADYDQTEKTNIRSGNIRNPRSITCKRKSIST